MNVLKTITVKDKQIEQLYYGNQTIHYRIDGEEIPSDSFWRLPLVEINYNQIIEKLNG